ncbi:MAG: hypothetical protein J7M27_03465 [Candidatus Latescibacteria bacterium]|nr:hypothetical protein [Candidatus Latescibacterota bacterium]
MLKRTDVVVLLLVSMVFGIGCSVPNEPEAPTWDTQFVIPIADYTYEFEEMLEEVSDIKDEDGNQVLFAEGDTLFVIQYDTERPERFEVYQKLEMDPLVKESYRQEIGDIVIDLEERNDASFPFRDVYSQEDFEKQQGEKRPIPAITFEDTTGLAIGREQNFYRMLIEEKEGANEIKFHLHNGLPVDIANLAVLLLSEKGYEDFVTGEQKPPMSFISGGYVTDVPREMRAGEYVEVVLPLYGKTIPRDVVFKIEGYTRQRGSMTTVDTTFSIPVGVNPATGEVVYQDTTVTLPADTDDWVEINEELLDASITMEMMVSKLEAAKVEARIPAQYSFDENTFDLRNPQMTIQSAKLAQGKLLFDISSYMPVDTEIMIDLPEFGRTKTIHVPKKQGEQITTKTVIMDFTGETLSFPDTSRQELTYRVEVVTSEEERAVMSNEDFIDINVRSDLFVIDELTGYLGGKHDIPVMTQEIPLGDMPEGLEDGISFKEVRLDVQFYVDMGASDVPMTAHLEITGKKEDGRTKGFVVEEPISKSDTYIVDIPSEKATELVNFMPDSIQVGGYVSMMKGELSTFSAGSGFQFGGTVEDIRVSLTMPLIFRLKPISMTIGEVEEVEIEEAVRELFERDDVKKVCLLGEIDNRNPLSGRGLVLISTDPTSFDSTATLAARAKIDTLVNMDLPQPRFYEDGSIAEKGTAAVSVVLDSTDFDHFEHSPVFIKTEVALDNTDVAPNEEGWVFINPSEDFINIKLRADVEVRLDVDRLTE